MSIESIWQLRQGNGVAEPGETIKDVAAMLLTLVETYEPTGETDANGMHVWRQKPVLDEIEQYANKGDDEGPLA